MKFYKYVFLVIGAGMLFGSFNFYTNTKSFINVAAITEGEIIELIEVNSSDSTTYKPVFEFSTTNGNVYRVTSSTSTSPPSYFVGEIVDVLYKENSPREAKINGYFSLWGTSIIMGFIGIIFFSIGFGPIAYSYIKGKKNTQLKNTGLKVLATYQGVKLNESFKVNGRSPYKIHAQWVNPSTSNEHLFKSANIWFDPSEFIQGNEITVYIEQDNPKKYYVDITFLPK